VSAASRPRAVATVAYTVRQLEGAGFPVRRPFPTAGLLQVDPFLLLDEMGPVTWAPGSGIGAPDHPHRGFETVTYLLAGEMQHKDSAGHSGRLGPGDAQWMTAGAGVVHSELPSERFMREGGVMHGFQLWVNLPAAEKMAAPRYQEIPAERLPQASGPDGRVHARVLAGEAFGVSAVIETHTPISYLHFRVEPGGTAVQPVPRGWNAFVYVFRGKVSVGEPATEVEDGQLAQLADGDTVRFAAPAGATDSAELLLIAGQPLNEPVSRHGPFVMNTEAQIRDAIRDYREGRMGVIGH
jgi:quercetin 2,3-dioxygenase